MQISDRISEKTNGFFLAFFEDRLKTLISAIYENAGFLGYEKRFVYL